MIIPLILGFVLGAAAIIFILENTAIVNVMFLHWQFQTSIAVVIILSILVGALLALLLTLPGAIGSAFSMRRLRKHNEALAREAEANRQAAEDAHARLIVAQTPRPDVVDLTS